MNATRRISPLHRRFSVLPVCLAAVLTASAAARAQDAAGDAAAAAPRTPADSTPLVVRDMVVFLSDKHGDQLNAQVMFDSTLPTFVVRRRETAASAERHQPSPIGLMTFQGPDDVQLDVLLEAEGGRFLSTWPGAEVRTGRALWRSAALNADVSRLSTLPADHWLAPLREAEDRRYITTGRNSERFLLYDLEAPHQNRLDVQIVGTGDSAHYTLATSGHPLHDVWLLSPTDEGWRIAQVDQVMPTEAASAPASAPEAEANEQDNEQAGEQASEVTPDATSAADSLSPVTLSDASHSADALQDAWREQLTALQLGEAEAQVISTILVQHALDPHQLTVVYRLDPAAMEAIMPLEVTPMPQQRVRVGLVVLLNAAPDLASRLERLIAQLGDQQWRTRDAAQKRLAEFGTAAKLQLEAALKHEDLEVVYRAEQLLAMLAHTDRP